MNVCVGGNGRERVQIDCFQSDPRELIDLRHTKAAVISSLNNLLRHVSQKYQQLTMHVCLLTLLFCSLSLGFNNNMPPQNLLM